MNTLVGSRRAAWIRSVQFAPVSGFTTLSYALALMLIGTPLEPTRRSLPMPSPSGRVHFSPLAASQLAVMIGEKVR